MDVEWIILATNSYTVSRSFYADTLKLPIVREVAEDEFTQFQLKHGFLAIYGKKEVEKLLGKSISQVSGSAIYTLKEVPNVDEYADELKSKGVTFLKEPQTQPWGQRTAYFEDPDGHIWEIQQWVNT